MRPAITILNYRDEKQRLRRKTEEIFLHNSPFLKKEMQETLKTCIESSPGPDDFNHEMIKQHVAAILFLRGIEKPGKDPENQAG
jgi:hypothetical protein